MANGFIFGGDTGLSYQDLVRRRAIVEALGAQQARRGAPRNIGEGLSALGSAIGYRRALSNLNRMEAAGQRSAQEAFSPIVAALTNQFPDTAAAGGTAAGANIFGEAGSLAEREAYIRESAAQRGVDPDTAVRVARSEGLAPGVYQSNVVNEQGIREPSFGDFQFLVGGPGTGYPEGLGNEFIAQTGLDPRDRSTWRQQIDFALDQAVHGGWSPWYGAAKAGISRWQGLPRRQSAIEEQRAPGNILAGGGDLAMADALRAADRLQTEAPIQVASGESQLIPIIRNATKRQLDAMDPALMSVEERAAATKRYRELGDELEAQLDRPPAAAPSPPAVATPAPVPAPVRPDVTRPVTPTPPAALEPAPRGPVGRGGALPPVISPELDERIRGAPQARPAPRTVEEIPAQGVAPVQGAAPAPRGRREPTRAERLAMFNEFVRRSGSRQLAEADPTRGILGALTGLGRPTRRPGFPPRPITIEGTAVANVDPGTVPGQRAPGNMLAGGDDAAVRDALLAADAMAGTNVAPRTLDRPGTQPANVNIFGEPQAAPVASTGTGLRSPALIQALLNAAQNPFLSEGQQRIVGALLNQALTPQERPDPITLGTGDVLVDPRTGRQIAAGAPATPRAPTVVEVFTEGGGRQMMLYNPETQQFEPLGGEAPPRGGTTFSVDPETGAIQFSQGGVAQDGIQMGKPPTEAESKTIVYVTRAAGALPVLDQYDVELKDFWQQILGQDPTGAIRQFQTPEYQQARQAGLEFLQAILRKDTGAAITPAETEEYGKTYLPQPGDGDEVIQQKRQSRRRALEAMERGLFGKELLLWERNERLKEERAVEDNGDLPRPQTQAEYDALPPGAVYIDPEDGKRYRKPAGGNP